MNQPHKRSDRFILPAMLAGIILGVYCGWEFGPKMLAVKFIGDMFMNALKAVIIPLIMASMIVGVAGLGDVRKLGPIGGVTLIYYILTTSISVTIGLIVTNSIQPGVGVDLSGAAVPEVIEGHSASIIDLILSLIPSNVFQCMAEMRILPIIVSTLIFGGVLTTLGEQGKPVVQFFEGLNAAMMKIVHLLMYFAPIGIFALIAAILGKEGGGDAVLVKLMNLGWFVVAVLTGLALHAFLVIPSIMAFIARRNPLVYASNMVKALTTAFSTDSSAATLPITMECVQENNKISSQTASFVLPIGATVNMDGTALYEAAAAIFIAQAYGVDLSFVQQVTVFLTATLASVGAAAIPHAGLVTLVIVLQAVNLPIEGIGLIFAVDWFLDRCRTTVNVWGDSCGAATVERLIPPENGGNSGN